MVRFPEKPDEIFKTLSYSELLRSFIIFKLCSAEHLVKRMPAMINFLRQKKLDRVTNAFFRHTFFKKFCGGSDAAEVIQNIESLNSNGIGTILDYASETFPAQSNQSEIQAKTKENYLKSIEIISSVKHVTEPLVAIKLTSLFDPSSLTDLGVYDDQTETEWKKFERYVSRSKELERRLMNLIEVCQAAKEANVRVAIDAEQSIYQKGINVLTNYLMDKFNRQGILCVLNTYQMYRKDSRKMLERDLDRSRRLDYGFGAKFVRGAYLFQERSYVENQNGKSILYETEDETHSNYNQMIHYIFKYLKDDTSDRHFHIVFATHNIDSIRLACNNAFIKPLNDKNIRISFAQLFGMGDCLTYTLSNCKYDVYKYLPYGPVEEVIPYLIRRAQENAAVFKLAHSDATLILNEMKDRSGVFKIK